MKITVFGIRGFPNIQGGAEKHCEELYTRLSSKDVHIKVIRRKPYLNKHSEKKYNHIEFKDSVTLKNKYLETPIHSLHCAFDCLMDRPDIVHIHNIASAFTLPLLRLFRLKCVLTYHSSNYEHVKWNLFAKSMLRLFEKMALLLSNRVIFVSRSKREQFKKIAYKSYYIPNGITTYEDIKPSISLSNYNLKKEKFILSVGRIVPEKRFLDLVQAFERITTDYKLVIAGGYDNISQYYKKILNYKDSLKDRLILTGFLKSNDIKLLYENASFFVLPSENEGMPIVLLEAMSFGLCPLVSDIKENLDVISDYGYTFKTKDIICLKEKLQYMLTHKSEVDRIGISARDYVNKEYKWKNVADNTMKVHKELISD